MTTGAGEEVRVGTPPHESVGPTEDVDRGHHYTHESWTEMGRDRVGSVHLVRHIRPDPCRLQGSGVKDTSRTECRVARPGFLSGE